MGNFRDLIGETFGELTAVEFREKIIAELNAQGAGYTENHGK